MFHNRVKLLCGHSLWEMLLSAVGPAAQRKRTGWGAEGLYTYSWEQQELEG